MSNPSSLMQVIEFFDPIKAKSALSKTKNTGKLKGKSFPDLTLSLPY